MFTVIIETTFSASHAVVMPDGLREQPHSHDWALRVGVSVEKLDKQGFAVEFEALRDIINEEASRFSGKDIGLMEQFKGLNPTAEAVCQYLFEAISGRVKSGKTRFVELTEAAGCIIRYEGESC